MWNVPHNNKSEMLHVLFLLSTRSFPHPYYKKQKTTFPSALSNFMRKSSSHLYTLPRKLFPHNPPPYSFARVSLSLFSTASRYSLQVT